MVHDPVMAFEDSTYYIFATGMGIQQMTSNDRKNWTILPEPAMSVIPQWAMDSVPGFRIHVWAPDVINYHGKWWLAYSCSTFGRNGSLACSPSVRSPSLYGTTRVVSSPPARGATTGTPSTLTSSSMTTITLGSFGVLSGMAFNLPVSTRLCILLLARSLALSPAVIT